MLRLVVTPGRDHLFQIPATEAREWDDALRHGLERVGAPYHDEWLLSHTEIAAPST